MMKILVEILVNTYAAIMYTKLLLPLLMRLVIVDNAIWIKKIQS